MKVGKRELAAPRAATLPTNATTSHGPCACRESRQSAYDSPHDGNAPVAAGVDINTIRAWLGHVSLATTNVYAEVDLEMKAKPLANCQVKEDEPKKPWREDKGVMEFLRTL